MYYDIITDNSTPVERKLTVTVYPDMIREYWDKNISKLKKDITVQGFRKGTAPNHLVERHVGIKELIETVAEDVKVDVINDVVKNFSRKPMSPPRGECVLLVSEGKKSKFLQSNLEIEISYFLPPPTPEEIETDINRQHRVLTPGDPVQNETQDSSGGFLPDDPRKEVTGLE
jgi:FKBP-type peptidyl-prolyl cis-trans isomerase (trigger factor)